MSILTYDELEESVNNVARKWSRKILNVTLEDLRQDLWVWMIEKKPEDLALARTQLVNRALDLKRKYDSRNGGIYSTDYNDPKSMIEIDKITLNLGFNNTDEEIIRIEDINSIINKLESNKRERAYVIVKLYLNENILELEDEYKKLYDNLSEDEKHIVDNYIKDNYTDDIIAKSFLHIKTGTNAGSMRTLKSNLKRIFSDIKR